VTNIRNVMSPHWRGWLGSRNRCIVLATSYCEYADTRPRKTPTWFALSEDRPLFAFALWTHWHRSKPLVANPGHFKANDQRHPLGSAHGAPWRRHAVRYGNWNSVFVRFTRWSKLGTWAAACLFDSFEMRVGGHIRRTTP
jgi:hypothetical protein